MMKEYRPSFLLKYGCLRGECDWYLVLTRQPDIPETKEGKNNTFTWARGETKEVK